MRLLLVCLSLLFTPLTLSRSEAGFVVNILQVGNDIVATGSGTLNTSAIAFAGITIVNPNVSPSSGIYRAGVPGTVLISNTNSIVGPLNFGNIPSGNSNHFTTISSGDQVGISAFSGQLIVPTGYVSGTQLNHTAVWTNATYNSLGLVIGSYVYTWGSGPTADSLTINVSAVPEPSVLLLSLVGASVCLLRRKSKPQRSELNKRKI